MTEETLLPEISAYMIQQTVLYRGEFIEITTEPRPTQAEAEVLFEQLLEQARAAIDHAFDMAEAMTEGRGQVHH